MVDHMGRKRHISKCWHLAKCGEKLHVRKEASFVPTPAADVKGLHYLARWVKIVNLNLKKSMNPTSPAETLPLTDCDRWPASLLLWQRHVGENRRRERLAKQYLAWLWNLIFWMRSKRMTWYEWYVKEMRRRREAMERMVPHTRRHFWSPDKLEKNSY